MAKVAYLILTHKNGPQIVRLANALLHGGPERQLFILHNGAFEPLDVGPLEHEPRVHVRVEQHEVAWGDYSLTEKALRGLRWVLQDGRFDWMVLLSGQDYPLRSVSEFEDSLAVTSYDAFINGVPIDSGRPCNGSACNLAAVGDGPCRRCQELYLYQYYRPTQAARIAYLIKWLTARAPWLIGAGPGRLPLLRTMKMPYQPAKHQTMIGVRALRNPFHQGFRCYKGELWMTANRRAVFAIDEFCKRSPAVLRYYRRTVLSDESLFTTILRNDPTLKVADGLDYAHWVSRNAPSPSYIREDDLPQVLASGFFLGRKFDSTIDSAVLDRLDVAQGRGAGAALG